MKRSLDKTTHLNLTNIDNFQGLIRMGATSGNSTPFIKNVHTMNESTANAAEFIVQGEQSFFQGRTLHQHWWKDNWNE